MGPIAWSSLAVIVCACSIGMSVSAGRLRHQCRHAGSRDHVAEVERSEEQLSSTDSRRPVVWFRFAMGVTVGYWAVMFAFYLSSLGSTRSLAAFFSAFLVMTLPAVLISGALSIGFLTSGRRVVRLSTSRGPAVTGIESRCLILIAGWIGVAVYMLLFAGIALSRGL